LDKKCREAASQGVKTLIIIPESYLKKEVARGKEQVTPPEPAYQDAVYFLPQAKPEQAVPCIQLTESGCAAIEKIFGLDFIKTEQQIGKQLSSTPRVFKPGLKLNFDISLDTLVVCNVIGTLRGADTTKTVILGAHYDHLGKRDDCIYYGSDDNASGVAGLLATADSWVNSNSLPPCNLVFASWTAEEKGLIGSEYYVSQLKNPEKTELYINMDMISRSVTEDTACRMLSIGTRTADEYLREMARKSNSTLGKPFLLDLWDVTGHTGSDYASFTAKNIPILTFNAGLHDDYHTPRDTAARADHEKMGSILQLVNSILNSFLTELPNRK
jgi:Zn-dependent M28 family amino/carboxypeptidase